MEAMRGRKRRRDHCKAKGDDKERVSSGLSSCSSDTDDVLVLQVPAAIQGSLPAWHAKFSLCRVVARTRNSVRLRLLSRCTDAADEWVRLDSPRLNCSRFPSPSALLPPFSQAITQRRLSPRSLQWVDQALASVQWQPTNSDAMYQFGHSPMLQDSAPDNPLRDELHAACAAKWGKQFCAVHKLWCNDGHFLVYHPGDRTPPWHFDIRASVQGQQVANVLIYVTDVPAGGETLLAKGEVTISPRRGECVIWRSYTDDGLLDHRAIHSAAPVLCGTKIALCLSIRRD